MKLTKHNTGRGYMLEVTKWFCVDWSFSTCGDHMPWIYKYKGEIAFRVPCGRNKDIDVSVYWGQA